MLDEVEAGLAGLDGVEAVHDLHVWPLSTTETALTAHIVAPLSASPMHLLDSARRCSTTASGSSIARSRSSAHHPADHNDC